MQAVWLAAAGGVVIVHMITRSARLDVDGAGLGVARRMPCGTLCAVWASRRASARCMMRGVRSFDLESFDFGFAFEL